jgi:hypothetical protein
MRIFCFSAISHCSLFKVRAPEGVREGERSVFPLAIRSIRLRRSVEA